MKTFQSWIKHTSYPYTHYIPHTYTHTIIFSSGMLKRKISFSLSISYWVVLQGNVFTYLYRTFTLLKVLFLGMFWFKFTDQINSKKILFLYVMKLMAKKMFLRVKYCPLYQINLHTAINSSSFIEGSSRQSTWYTF